MWLSILLAVGEFTEPLSFTIEDSPQQESEAETRTKLIEQVRWPRPEVGRRRVRTHAVASPLGEMLSNPH